MVLASICEYTGRRSTIKFVERGRDIFDTGLTAERDGKDSLKWLDHDVWNNKVIGRMDIIWKKPKADYIRIDK